MFKPFIPRFLGAMAYTLSLLVIGTIGYSIIEGWPTFEALYMTAITISAVGYEEVRPLTPAGRTFTMAMIFLGVTAIGVYLALLTSFLVEIDLHSTFERKKRMKRIAALNQHIIVCGAGRTGRRVVTDLVQAEQQLIVVEVDPDRIAELQEDHPEVLCI